MPFAHHARRGFNRQRLHDLCFMKARDVADGAIEGGSLVSGEPLFRRCELGRRDSEFLEIGAIESRV